MPAFLISVENSELYKFCSASLNCIIIVIKRKM